MIYKWIGAALVFSACGTTGFRASSEHRRELRNLRSLVAVLDWMHCELSYHLTPLPQLCQKSAVAGSSDIRTVMYALSRQLDQQTCPDVVSAMSLALQNRKGLSRRCRSFLENLGMCLGRFDLSGQLSGIASVREQCSQELSRLTQNREQRLRSYQTLGLCAGAALVILFL